MHHLCVILAAVLFGMPQAQQPAVAPSPPKPVTPAPSAPPAPSEPGVTPASPPANAAPVGFPSSWVGRWVGSADIVTPAGVQTKFVMELLVVPTASPDKFDWVIIYDGSFGRQERKYALLVKDAAQGVFAIDELNSIVLPARMLAGALRSDFVVQGNRITTREEMVGAGTPDERILVEMVTTVESEVGKTGGVAEAPQVSTWLPVSVQRGTLRRVK